MDNKIIREALLNGLYHDEYDAHELLSPKLLTNNKQQRIWETLKQELKTCKSFIWSVAFITSDMLPPLKVILADLAKNGVKGVIITGSYLNFNQPKMFAELLKLDNIEVKITNEDGFHTKGYLFEHENYQTLIIGSANFTRAAMLKNYEWSLRLTSTNQGDLTNQISREFEKIILNSEILTSNWIEKYNDFWQKMKVMQRVPTYYKEQKILPNQMQKIAIKELHSLVKENKHKALVVSATGTGKTYLGAFAVKEYRPKKFLFVVHREQIAKKALKSFQKVIGGEKNDYDILSGNSQNLKAKYIFATIQTLSQDKMLKKLNAKYFDYILIDEAHRAAAPSYQKIMNHFKPNFWLGMTATPERMDSQSVFALFDYNLAYEIRLRDALENKMLCPFHYIGVEDYEADDGLIDETTNLKYLVASKRIQYILQQMEYYGYDGDEVHGLIFCSRQEEARLLAKEFTKRGHLAVALTNQDSNETRRRTVKQLEKGEIEYIITVNLFNEGIDIPCINQVIMLRNTQSSTIFIQQLGRGLRKHPHKEFVTVLDFIGNYKNNYLIPIALTQDDSRSIDEAKSELKVPPIIDVSTINFTKIAQERILQSLDKVKLDSMKELRQAYQDLKDKLGKVPMLDDFYKFGSVSPIVFASNNNLNNYAEFLNKMGEKINLTAYQHKILTFITKELLNGKRPHELILLDLLIKNSGKCTIDEYESNLRKQGAYCNTDLLNSIENILNLHFFDVKSGKTTKKQQYGGKAIVNRDNLLEYQLSQDIVINLKDNLNFQHLFIDAIKTGLAMSQEYNYQTQFTLYKKYNRKDVCRLLNWEKDVSAPMYGYRVGKEECPIFITYKKDDEEKRNARYHNNLSNGKSLRWYTRSPRHLESDEVQRLLQRNQQDKYQVKLHLFVKRSDADGKEFYYLGNGKIIPNSVREEILNKKVTVGMDIELIHPLELKMYQLLFDD